MTKKQRLRELCEHIKDTYNLDVVTAVSTKSKFLKEGYTWKPEIVLFKMRYKLTGDDVVQYCPISWVAINAGEDALIIQTVGEMLASHPDVKRTLSNMASNAVMRSSNNIVIENRPLRKDEYIIDPFNPPTIERADPFPIITHNEPEVSEETKTTNEPKPKSK